MLSPSEALKREPLLAQKNLKGEGYYVEYKTDDARLTIEVVKKAVELGGLALNYTKADEFIYENNKVVGIIAEDQITGESFPIYAKKVINATRSEEHTSELQSRGHLVCRLLLEKKKKRHM